MNPAHQSVDDDFLRQWFLRRGATPAQAERCARQLRKRAGQLAQSRHTSEMEELSGLLGLILQADQPPPSRNRSE